MSKFNTTNKGSTQTLNHESGEAFTLSPKVELYSAAVTTFLSDKLYEKETETLDRIKKLVKEIGTTDPEFVAKLAVYAREQMHLRTLPLVLLVELAKVHSGDTLVSRAIARVVSRADEIPELLAYYAKTNDRTDFKKLGKLSKQIQKGLSVAFNKFDAYQFAKYSRDTSVKMRDALFVVHPKPKDEATRLVFEGITNNTLETPYTWETELSKGGDKKVAWEALIDSGKLGYMALLRNLRNIVAAKVSNDHLEKVAVFISDRERVLKSKQLPFRFLAAYREIRSAESGKVPLLMEALERAAVIATANIEGIGVNDRIHISVDTSGSMSTLLSARSKLNLQDVGLILAMLFNNDLTM